MNVRGNKIMLKEFRVKNFRSFRDWLVFKLDNVRDYSFNENCIKNGLVNKAVIYGKNSSGKSNLGFAIMDISTHLFDGMNAMRFSPYLNLNSTESEASFVYVFKFEDEEYLEERKEFSDLNEEQLEWFYKHCVHGSIYISDYQNNLGIEVNEASDIADDWFDYLYNEEKENTFEEFKHWVASL